MADQVPGPRFANATSGNKRQQIGNCRDPADQDSGNLGKADNGSRYQRQDDGAVFNIVARLECVVPMIKDF